MKKRILLIVVILLAAAALITALLLANREIPATPTTGTSAQGQTAGTTQAQSVTEAATQPQQTTVGQTEATESQQQIQGNDQPSSGGISASKPTQATDPTVDSKPESGGVEDWTSEPTQSGQPSQPTEPTQSSQPTQGTPAGSTEATDATEPEGNLGVEDWESGSSQSPGAQTPQLTDMTWSQFIALSAKEQEQVIDAMGLATYSAWQAEAKKAYEDGKEVITGNGDINLGDYLK